MPSSGLHRYLACKPEVCDEAGPLFRKLGLYIRKGDAVAGHGQHLISGFMWEIGGSIGELLQEISYKSRGSLWGTPIGN